MFIRVHTKGATSELINIDNALCIGHRKWHDSDELAVTACFTSDRTLQSTMFLTGPLSPAKIEIVIESIGEAIQAGIPILDLREYGDHSGAHHNVHKDHAVVHHSGVR